MPRNNDLTRRSDAINSSYDEICDMCAEIAAERIDAIPPVEKNMLSPRSCAIIMAYTGVAMLRGEKLRHFYSYLAELYGRPIFTHELSYLDDLADMAKADFLALCAEVNDESD